MRRTALCGSLAPAALAHRVSASDMDMMSQGGIVAFAYLEAKHMVRATTTCCSSSVCDACSYGPELPSRGQLWRATAVAVMAASVLLVTVVLPAEYGIDPTAFWRKCDCTRARTTGKSIGLVT